MPGATCGVPEPFFVATDQEDEDRLNRWGDLCFRGSCPTFVAPADITCVHRRFRAILDRISRGDPRHRHGWGALVAATASSVAVIAALLLTGSATIGIGRLIPMVWRMPHGTTGDAAGSGAALLHDVQGFVAPVAVAEDPFELATPRRNEFGPTLTVEPRERMPLPFTYPTSKWSESPRTSFVMPSVPAQHASAVHFSIPVTDVPATERVQCWEEAGTWSRQPACSGSSTQRDVDCPASNAGEQKRRERRWIGQR